MLLFCKGVVARIVTKESLL